MGKAKIYLILFLVVAAWGFNVTATKILVTNFTPVTMTAARIFVAGVFVFIFLTFMKRVRRLTKESGAQSQSLAYSVLLATNIFCL